MKLRNERGSLRDRVSKRLATIRMLSGVAVLVPNRLSRTFTDWVSNLSIATCNAVRPSSDGCSPNRTLDSSSESSSCGFFRTTACRRRDYVGTVSTGSEFEGEGSSHGVRKTPAAGSRPWSNRQRICILAGGLRSAMHAEFMTIEKLVSVFTGTSSSLSRDCASNTATCWNSPPTATLGLPLTMLMRTHQTIPSQANS
eukprot:5623519-Prymnesium_polylepis.2